MCLRNLFCGDTNCSWLLFFIILLLLFCNNDCEHGCDCGC